MTLMPSKFHCVTSSLTCSITTSSLYPHQLQLVIRALSIIILILPVSTTYFLQSLLTLQSIFLWNQEHPALFHSLPIMCLNICACYVGFSLITLSLVCILGNVLLLVPNGKLWSRDQLSLHVLLMAGLIGGGLMVLCQGIVAVLVGIQGCCGAVCCGGRCRVLFAALGMLGAIYCFSVSRAGLRNGPKCLMNGKWDYHFRETSGAYLSNRTQWFLCEEPPNVVLWNVTLFSVLVAASSLEIVLCGIQLVNAILSVICGCCSKQEDSAH